MLYRTVLPTAASPNPEKSRETESPGTDAAPKPPVETAAPTKTVDEPVQRVPDRRELSLHLLKALRLAAENNETPDAKKLTEAQIAAKVVLAQNPDHRHALWELAWGSYQSGDYKTAERCYRRLAELSPTPTDQLEWQANSLAMLQQFDEAERVIGARLRITPARDARRTQVPGTYRLQASKRAEYWQRIASQLPETGYVQAMIAGALTDAKQNAIARTSHAAAADRWPDSTYVLWMAANDTWVMDSDPGPSIKWAERLLRIDPSNAYALQHCAIAATRSNDHAKAARYWQQWLAAPHSPLASSTLAVHWSSDSHLVNDELFTRWLDRWLLQFEDAPRVTLPDPNIRSIEDVIQRHGTSPKSVAGKYVLTTYLVQTIADLRSESPFAILLRLNSLRKLGAATMAGPAGFENEAGLAAAGFLDDDGIRKVRDSQLAPMRRALAEQLDHLIEFHPSFHSPKLLAASVAAGEGNTERATQLLNSIVKDVPSAVQAWLRLAEILPPAEALNMMDRAAGAAPNHALLQRRKIELLDQLGDSHAAANAAWELLGKCDGADAYFAFEYLAKECILDGDLESALSMLEYSTTSRRTPSALLSLGKLRESLSKPLVIETYIDAWRASPRGSATEIEADKRLRSKPLQLYVCRTCGGRGTVERIANVGRADSIDAGQVYYQNYTCDQCAGLGLWHPGAK
jgi:tetratricopeptide (TPR) repeat protein